MAWMPTQRQLSLVVRRVTALRAIVPMARTVRRRSAAWIASRSSWRPAAVSSCRNASVTVCCAVRMIPGMAVVDAPAVKNATIIAMMIDMMAMMTLIRTISFSYSTCRATASTPSAMSNDALNTVEKAESDPTASSDHSPFSS